uniref:Uncharacterized protein n=1 Tax=Anguilla anguilla TaxID=7936 RepID=A0A0E9SNE8_ANGAN
MQLTEAMYSACWNHVTSPTFSFSSIHPVLSETSQ